MPAAGESAFTEDEITGALIGLIAWAGNASAAVRSLKAEGKRCPTAVTLTEWSRSRYAARFNELSEKYRDQLETQLVNRYRFITARAMDAQELLIDRAIQQAKKPDVENPARMAADMATVADKSNRAMLALSGRPTSIREDRNLEEILRSLAARKVITLTDEPAQIEQQAT